MAFRGRCTVLSTHNTFNLCSAARLTTRGPTFMPLLMRSKPRQHTTDIAPAHSNKSVQSTDGSVSQKIVVDKGDKESKKRTPFLHQQSDGIYQLPLEAREMKHCHSMHFWEDSQDRIRLPARCILLRQLRVYAQTRCTSVRLACT